MSDASELPAGAKKRLQQWSTGGVFDGVYEDGAGGPHEIVETAVDEAMLVNSHLNGRITVCMECEWCI